MNQMAERAASLGKALSVQGVLYGSVTHYAGIHARDADVGFKLWLLEPSSGRTLWSATYAKTNKPLSENLFRLKEMLDKGLELEGRVELVNGGFKEAATKLEALRIGDAKEMSQGF
jgi:hypothetical protein